MTRETKVGLVVSASFLCLLGAVFYCKLKETDSAPVALAKGEPVAAPADPTPVGSPESAASGWSAPGAVQPQSLDPRIIQAVGINPPATGTSGELPSTPSAATSSAPDKSKDLQAVPSTATGATGATPKEEPKTPGSVAPENGVAPAGNAASTSPVVANPPKGAPTGPGSPAGPGATADPNGLGNNNSPVSTLNPSAPGSSDAKPTVAPDNRNPVDPGKAPADSATQTAVGATRSISTPSNAPTGSPSTPSATSPPSVPRTDGAVPPPGQSALSNLAPGAPIPSAVSGPASPDPAPNGAGANMPQASVPSASNGVTSSTTQTGTQPQTPGANLLPPVPSPQGSNPTDSAGLTPGALPNRPISPAPAADDAPDSNVRFGQPTAPLPPANQFAQGPLAPGMNSPAANADLYRATPPAGAPPRADSPPITVPPAGGSIAYGAINPQVESYDEETYLAKQNDTFASISRQHYQSDKYERALLQFNRNHPRAADSVRQDPPVLREGQPVYIPPLRVLERQYAAVIPDHIPLPPPVAPAPVAGQAPVSSVGAAGSSQGLYRVRANGEMLWDIATRTLGRGERWSEIYSLNSQFNPQQPIPGGYTLRMPADASIQPQDRP